MPAQCANTLVALKAEQPLLAHMLDLVGIRILAFSTTCHSVGI
jgi:hypothetical protein